MVLPASIVPKNMLALLVLRNFSAVLAVNSVGTVECALYGKKETNFYHNRCFNSGFHRCCENDVV
jgi:hypothetical protein